MGWTRNYPLVMGAGVAFLLFSLVGVAAITGVLPSDAWQPAPKPQPGKSAVARKAACDDCGVVADVRAIPVRGEGSRHFMHRVTLRMDDGSERVLSLAEAPPFGIGARVRVNGATLERGQPG